jgi:hypothetical protein
MVYADEQAVLHQAAEAVLDVRRGEEMKSFRFPAKDDPSDSTDDAD